MGKLYEENSMHSENANYSVGMYDSQIKTKLGSARNNHELSAWVGHLLRILVEDNPLC